MLYFRKVAKEAVEYHATTASGAWFAVTRKGDEDDHETWSISFDRQKTATPKETGLTLEEAFEAIELQYAVALDEKATIGTGNEGRALNPDE